MYLAGWAMYVWVEIITFYRSRPRKSYFTNMKNLYEMALLTTEALMVMQWVTFTTSTTRQNFDSNAQGYTDMYQVRNQPALATRFMSSCVFGLTRWLVLLVYSRWHTMLSWLIRGLAQLALGVL